MSNLTDGESFTSNFLQHVGVRGMKWGHRKDKGNSAVGIEDTHIKIKTAPGKIEVHGGRGRMPSEDATKAAAYRQIAKASSTHALTNKELKTLVERMNLEQQYAKVVSPTTGAAPKAKAAAWVTGKLSKVGNMFIDTAANIKVSELVNQAMNTEQTQAERQARIAVLTDAARARLKK